MGDLLGHAVRFGAVQDVLAAGEGIETILSLKSLLPDMPMVAALSAANLAALLLPPSLRRLYVAVDNDPAGRRAAMRLTARARAAGLQPQRLHPRGDDWNTDLRLLGPQRVSAFAAAQLAPEDVERLARMPRL
jgi:hypothetical protein